METLTMNPIAAEVKLLEPASTAPKRDEAKPKKRSSVRHTRAIQRDRTQRPLGAPPDEAVVERLTEIVSGLSLRWVGRREYADFVAHYANNHSISCA